MSKSKQIVEEELEEWSVEDYIGSFKLVIPKQLQFIKDNDWTKESYLNDRISMYKLQEQFTSTALTHAVNLQSVKGVNMDSVVVKKWMNTFLEFASISEKRVISYCASRDWLADLEDGKEVKDIQSEASFQAEMNKTLASNKKNIRKIKVGEEKDIDIPIFQDTPIPLMMHQVFEEKYPEIKEKLAKKRQERDGKNTKGGEPIITNKQSESPESGSASSKRRSKLQ